MALPKVSPSMVSDPAGDLELLRKAITEKNQQGQNDVTVRLSQHIHGVWQENQAVNKPIRQEMIAILKRVKGEYSDKKLAEIRAFKGSETYLRSGENKARAADSWIKDIYRSDVDLPWELKPSAVPSLPDETKAKIEEETRNKAAQMEAAVAASGQMVDPAEIAKLMTEYYELKLDEAMEALKGEADKRVERAAEVIRDQNQEGGWNNAFKEFLFWFIRLHAGIIKGPVLTKKSKQEWQPSANGGYELVTASKLVNDVYAVSPFNFFPSKGMKDTGNGNIIELHELTRQALSDMIGVPGYSEMEIRAVLEEYGSGGLKAKWFTIEDETQVNRVLKEVSEAGGIVVPSASTQGEMIWAMEFFGTVSGTMLIQWGAQGEIDPHKQYQANCWKIGSHVIKAVINPDPLGRKPYHVTSWAKNPEWLWGEGLLQFSAPLEDAINAVIRALINNVAIASGPMCEVDKDRVDTRVPIYPWRQIESTSMQMKNEGPAVNYYQPQMHAQELIAVLQFFMKVLDEMTVPAYAQGASQSGVTAGTATVFTQLLAAASRSIKAVIANIDDDIITPYTQMCYDQLMKTTTDTSIMGDAQAVAKGVAGLLVKEQQAQRKVEYLQVAANPAYTQILGAKNIGAILAQIAKSNDIQLPDKARLDGGADIEAMLQSIISAQVGMDRQAVDPSQANGQMDQGGGAPAQAQGTNPDGSKAGVVLAA